jgi:hypothetical protein
VEASEKTGPMKVPVVKNLAPFAVFMSGYFYPNDPECPHLFPMLNSRPATETVGKKAGGQVGVWCMRLLRA